MMLRGDDLVAAIKRVRLDASITRKALLAGAEILQNAIDRASPRHEGVNESEQRAKTNSSHIQGSVIIQKRRSDRSEMDERMSFMIGPSKRAFHAYFIEEGWRTRGPYRGTANKLNRMFSNRFITREDIDRLLKKYKMGSRRKIPGTHYIQRTFNNMKTQAIEAVISVYKKELEKRTRRGR